MRGMVFKSPQLFSAEDAITMLTSSRCHDTIMKIVQNKQALLWDGILGARRRGLRWIIQVIRAGRCSQLYVVLL